MVSRRLLVLNFEGVITTNPDPYALFIEKGVQLGLEAAHNLQRERIASPKKNLLHFISRLFVDLCRQTGLELQEISERFAAETHLYPGIRTLLESVHNDESIDVLIISDFNNAMLEQTLAAKKIALGRMDVVTNNLRMLAYGTYRPVMRSRSFVDCEYCRSNLCRGNELRTYLQEARQIGVSYFSIVLMGCSRSDLCAARLLDKKDFMCVPFGSELANILTKVTKSERIIRRVLRNLGFRIKMNHRLIYSDPRFVLRILRDGVIDSVGVGTCFVTVLQEKRARICGLPADSLPSAKLRFKDEIERSDEEGDKYMLNISPPFTVSRIAKGLTRDALCAKGVNRHNVGTVSESPTASSWMKCIQNIIDALDHFRKDHVIETEKTLVNGEVSDDYFCRRRGPHDMPRGCSTPIVQKTCVESEKEKEDYRARLFLPFSRSHAKPIPASEVEIPTPTSIWNESYKCQQLPSCRHPSVVGSGVKEFAEMAAMPRRLSNEKSLRGSIDWVKQSPTSPISISGFWPDMPRSHGRTVVNDAFRWSMEADGEDCRVSGKVAESPSTDINENDIELSELAHKRTCSMGGISVRKRSRVRSSGKIISESLLRYRGNNSDMFEYPGKLPQNLPEQLPGRWDFAAGNEDHSCGDINDVAPTNTASGISRIYTDEDHLFDPMRISVENLDTMRHDSGSLCSVLSCDVNDQHQSFVDVYEPVEFSSVAKVSCMHGNDIKSGTACNAYGVISLISWKTWGSHEGVPPLCVTKEFISPLSINQAREKQYTKDAKVSYENVVLSTYGSSSDDWCYHIGKNSIRRTHSSSDDKSYGRSE